MAGTGGAGDGRDGRRRGMLGKYLNELRSEGRGVVTTGGARARRGVVCWFRRVDVPNPQRGVKRWHGDVAGARGARRSGRSGEKTDGYSDRSDDAGTTCGAVVNGMVLCGSVRSAVCTDGVTVSATADGIGQYEGIGNPTAQPQQMASATVWASKRASVCTRIAAVDAEMARCDSAEDR